jgi:hypothetical protein
VASASEAVTHFIIIRMCYFPTLTHLSLLD